MAKSQEKLKDYGISLKEIPKYSCSDSKVDELISLKEPVVITETQLVSPALRWDMKYLEENIGDGSFTVYRSASHLFKYYDDKKINKGDGFVPGMTHLQLKFGEFLNRIKDSNSNNDLKKPPKARYYLQQPLNDTVGKKIVNDFVNFNWKLATSYQVKNGWGPLTSNLLLISQNGNVTPCHYDEQENLYAQVSGYKRVILFGPDQFKCLYPHPVHDPYDRQSQVDFDYPDLKKFPLFKNAIGYEAVLGPEDVLYLPSYWFHHFETLDSTDLATAITFWFKASAVGQIVYPLNACQKMAMMRNIEKMIGDALRDPKEIGPFWKTLIKGRYTD